MHIQMSTFHALYKAKLLSNYSFGRDKLLDRIRFLRYKDIPLSVASRFAMRSSYLNGAIFCDEVNL